MWSLALVEGVESNIHKWWRGKGQAASVGHVQSAGGKKVLFCLLLLAVVWNSIRNIQKGKSEMGGSDRACIPHSPVKWMMRCLSAQTSEPTNLSSSMLVSPLACQKLLHLSCSAKTSALPHNVLGHSWHTRAYLPLLSNNTGYITSSWHMTLFCCRQC